MNRQNIKMLAFLSVVIIIGAISIIFPKLDVAIAQSDDLLYDDWEDCIATETEEFCRPLGVQTPLGDSGTYAYQHANAYIDADPHSDAHICPANSDAHACPQ